MKILSVVLVVALSMSQFAFAAGGKGNKARTVIEIAKTHSLEKERVGREAKETAKVRAERIKAAAPALSAATGISAEKLVKVLTFNGKLIDMVLKSSESSDQSYKDLVNKLIDLYEAKMDMDVNSPNNKQMSKLAELLGSDKIAKEYLDFANEVATNMKTLSLKESMEVAAKRYAAKKGMSVSDWLKKLEECLG